MPLPRVSVLILTRDRPRLLSRAIESVLSQSFEEFEILVVHDGQDALTTAVMVEWAAKDSRIRYFHRDESGNIANATNFGLAQASGEFIAILDDDDRWADSDKLDMQVRFLRGNPECVCCGGGAIVVDQDSREVLRYMKPESDEAIRSRALIANPLVHSTVVYRAAAARSVGGYDESLEGYQDWDFALKLGESGKLHNLPQYLTFYSLWNGGGSLQQQAKNTACSIRIVWRHRREYGHFPAALCLSSGSYCYARLPQAITKNTYSLLSVLKKRAFSEAHPSTTAS